MKVLLFTHKIDIDGMGCAILAKLSFVDVKIVYAETFEINQCVQAFIDDGSIYNYDKIYVTDLCVKKPIIDFINQTSVLKEKFQILDHHKSEIEEGNGNYSFSRIQVSNENGKCSGTSLFYEYLLNNDYIKHSESLDYFVELTRQYDTWEWKTIYKNENSNDLNIAFILLGIEGYVRTMYNKLKDGVNLFDFELREKIKKYKSQMVKICCEYIKTMKIINLKQYSIGVITGVEDKYKNDIAERLKEMSSKIDFVAMVFKDRNTVSFRSVNSNVDVGKFAVQYGGKGHKVAGSCLQCDEILKDLQVTK